MLTQRLLIAIGAVLLMLFLGAGIVALFRPEGERGPLDTAGLTLWLNLFWLATGIGLGLAARRIWAGRK